MKRSLLTLTPYRYKFELAGQCLISNPLPGQMLFSGASGAGTVPLNIASIAVQASSNGIAGFYDVLIASPFRMTDLVNWPAFQAMYDAYKFGKVTLNLEYLNNVSAANTTGLMPTVYMYWDQDDASIPASVQSVAQKQGVKIRQFGDKSKTVQRFSFTPVVNTLLTTATGVTPISVAGVASKPQWINCAVPAIAHNAIKIAITDVYLPGSTAVNQAFRFNWTYHLSFRAPLLTA